MASAVNWTLLGLVIEHPSYGMDLYKRYQRMYADVLPISEASHIYTALNQLALRGFVEEIPSQRAPSGRRRQPKPHYRATRSGVRSYIDWLVELADVERKREALWVRQLGIFAHNPAAALQVISRFERQYLKGIGSYTDTGSHPAEGYVSDARTELIDGLVAERQRLALGGMVTWLQHAHDSFEALANKAQADAPPRA